MKIPERTASGLAKVLEAGKKEESSSGSDLDESSRQSSSSKKSVKFEVNDEQFGHLEKIEEDQKVEENNLEETKKEPFEELKVVEDEPEPQNDKMAFEKDYSGLLRPKSGLFMFQQRSDRVKSGDSLVELSERFGSQQKDSARLQSIDIRIPEDDIPKPTIRIEPVFQAPSAQQEDISTVRVSN